MKCPYKACSDWLKQLTLSENRAQLMKLLLLWKIKMQQMRGEISGLFIIKQMKNLGIGTALKKYGKKAYHVFSNNLIFFQALALLPACLITQQSTVNASLFVKYKITFHLR